MSVDNTQCSIWIVANMMYGILTLREMITMTKWIYILTRLILLHTLLLGNCSYIIIINMWWVQLVFVIVLLEDAFLQVIV